MKIIPLGDRVVIKNQEMNEVSKGGIILAACSLDMRKYLAKK